MKQTSKAYQFCGKKDFLFRDWRKTEKSLSLEKAFFPCCFCIMTGIQTSNEDLLGVKCSIEFLEFDRTSEVIQSYPLMLQMIKLKPKKMKQLAIQTLSGQNGNQNSCLLILNLVLFLLYHTASFTLNSLWPPDVGLFLLSQLAHSGIKEPFQKTQMKKLNVSLSSVYCQNNLHN